MPSSPKSLGSDRARPHPRRSGTRRALLLRSVLGPARGQTETALGARPPGSSRPGAGWGADLQPWAHTPELDTQGRKRSRVRCPRTSARAGGGRERPVCAGVTALPAPGSAGASRAQVRARPPAALCAGSARGEGARRPRPRRPRPPRPCAPRPCAPRLGPRAPTFRRARLQGESRGR